MGANPITGQVEIPGLTSGPMGVEAGPSFGFMNKVNMREGTGGRHFPFTSLTGQQQHVAIHCIRGDSADVTQAARTSWGGTPDDCFEYRNRNYAFNGANVGAQRGGIIQVQNRSGGRMYWAAGLYVEIDNRGTMTESQKGIRIMMRNNTGANLSTGSAALEIELVGQAAPSGYERAIDIVHNDASHVTKPTAIVVRAPSSSDGFAFALDCQANGLKKDGAAAATSAFAKFVDDGENADLASTLTTFNGAIKVVIGSTVGYIPTYQGYTAA